MERLPLLFIGSILITHPEFSLFRAKKAIVGEVSNKWVCHFPIGKLTLTRTILSCNWDHNEVKSLVRLIIRVNKAYRI